MTLTVTLGATDISSLIMKSQVKIDKNNQNDDGQETIKTVDLSISLIDATAAQLAVIAATKATEDGAIVKVQSGSTVLFDGYTWGGKMSSEQDDDTVSLTAYARETTDIFTLKARDGGTYLEAGIPIGDSVALILVDVVARRFFSVNRLLEGIADQLNAEYTYRDSLSEYYVGGEPTANVYGPECFPHGTLYDILVSLAKVFNASWRIDYNGASKELLFVPKKVRINEQVETDALSLSVLLRSTQKSDEPAVPDELFFKYANEEAGLTLIGTGWRRHASANKLNSVSVTRETSLRVPAVWVGPFPGDFGTGVTDEDESNFILTWDGVGAPAYITAQNIILAWHNLDFEDWSQRIKTKCSLIDESIDTVKALCDLHYLKVAAPAGYSGDFFAYNASVDLTEETVELEMVQ